MKKISNIIYILCFLLILAVPLCFTETAENVRSEYDNRLLAELPEAGDADFSGRFESYLRDRIGFRSKMMDTYQMLNDRIAGELTHPIYTYGKQGYVFFRMHDTIRYGWYHKTFADAVLKMKEYCNARGAEFYFVFDPEKISVYRQYLPNGVNYDDQWADELLEYMESLGIKCVNNKALLTELSKEEQVFNVKYDAGHWNDLGCFYATNNLWRTIHRDFPEVTEYKIEEFDTGTGIGKYLASSHFPVNEEVPSYRLKTGWNDISYQYDALDLNKNYSYFRYYVNNAPGSEALPRMLVFQGSYYNRSPQFLAGRAKEYIGVHNYQNVLDLDYYFNIFHPDLVVFEAAEYTFSDTYFDSSRMAGLEYAPSLAGPGEDSSTAAASAMEKAERYEPAEGSDLFILPRGGFDKVYTEADLSSARFVYLLTGGSIIDLKTDRYGVFSAGVPHGSVSGSPYIYYVDKAGKTYCFAVNIQNASALAGQKDGFSYSEGASYDAQESRYEFTTNIKGNRFSMVNMQLLDAEWNYLDAVTSAYWQGTFSGVYTHDRPTGNYIIRLKGNTNIKDEGIDASVYLVNGSKYYYSFDVPLLSKKKVAIKDYIFFGPCP